MQGVSNPELAESEKSMNNQFLRSQENEGEAWREVKVLKKEQEELRAKSSKEIEKFKK